MASLEKAMEYPEIPTDSVSISSTDEVIVRRKGVVREKRYSAPFRKVRDSVGSLDYLSESQGQLPLGDGVCLLKMYVIVCVV